MKTIGLALVTFVAVAVTPALAQQPSPPQQHQGAAPQASPSQPPMMSMCPMMAGGMMGAGMMAAGGMPVMGADSPRMLQIRGEMMRAMGDILIKHGKEIESKK